MARIRMIKPEFFDDPDIGELSSAARLVFIGLWTQADREGRLRDEPKRLRTRILPYDRTDMDVILNQLAAGGFISRYADGDERVIQVTNFLRHQIPGRDEPPSEFTAPDGSSSPDIGRNPNGTVRARIYNRDNYACAYCRRNMATDVRARCIDHVVPLSRGGTHFDFNLVTACKPCNAKKGAKNPDEAGLPWPDVTPRETVDAPLTGGPAPLTLKGLDRDLGLGSGIGLLDSGTRKLEDGARAPEKPQNDEPKWTHGQTRSRPGLVGNHIRCFHAPAACARGVCVPGFLGQQWMQQLSDQTNPGEYIAQIVGIAIRELPEGPLGDDPITYWRAVWSAKHGSQAPAKAAAAKPSSAASMQRARETFMAERTAKEKAV